MEKTVKLTLKTARKLYEEGEEGRLFALDNYSQEELTKPMLPFRWKDLKEVSGYWVDSTCMIKSTETALSTLYSDNRNIFPTEAQAKATLALAQLLHLRDFYNGGVKVVQDGSTSIPCIILHDNEWKSWGYSIVNTVFSFVSREVRDEFLENFKDNLLEEVKPLYM